MITSGITELKIQHEPIPAGKCLIGFSGGADSTALICLLARERDAGEVYPEAIHVNHGLRGRESDEDEAFCREFCRMLGIPFHSVRVDLHGKKDESTCRQERFRAFRTVLADRGIHRLMLAHNRDDIAETFLMRLMRGAGTEGLSCMNTLDTRDGYTIYRPLLRTGRDEIRNAMHKAGIPWREDSLNDSPDYLRNNVRNRLIPIMEEMASGVTERIAQTALILSSENSELQRQAESFLKEHSRSLWLDADSLQNVPPALHGRILRTWWKNNAPMTKEHALNASQTAELIRIASAGRGIINLPGNLHAEKCRNGLYLTGTRSKDPEEIRYGDEDIIYGSLVLHTSASRGNPGNGITCQELPVDFVRGCVIRSRKPGDMIRPFGMNGSKKLQDYLTDRGIDKPWRDEIPLLCRGNEVFMAAGVGTGAIPRWKADADNIRLEWMGEMPWKKKGKEVLA